MIGAIIGDIVGSRWEFNPTNDYDFRWLSVENDFTDDTICTIAVADALLQGRDFGESIHEWCRKYPYPTGGYGGRFAQWVHSDNPQPYNSYGNGAAMRVGPVAHWFDDEAQVLEAAKATALPTHNHPEGIKGAQAIAVAILFARQGKTKEEIKKNMQGLFDFDLTRTYLDIYNRDYTFNVICQTTVPEALISFFESESYEDCIFKAVLTNKDTDTAAAVAGAVAGAYYGVSDDIREKAYTYIPKEFADVINKLENNLLGC